MNRKDFFKTSIGILGAATIAKNLTNDGEYRGIDMAGWESDKAVYTNGWDYIKTLPTSWNHKFEKLSCQIHLNQ